MSNAKLFALSCGLLFAATVAVYHNLRTTPENVFEPAVQLIEPAVVCSWRNEEQELTNWYPGAIGTETRDLILSGQRLTLQQRLGRPLRVDEMSVRYYQVKADSGVVGFVLPRRIKGPHGAIEFVLGLDSTHRVQHFEIQSIREPAEVVAELERLGLEAKFHGHRSSDDLLLKLSDAVTSSAAARCVEQLANEVRTILFLWEAGEQSGH